MKISVVFILTASLFLLKALVTIEIFFFPFFIHVLRKSSKKDVNNLHSLVRAVFGETYFLRTKLLHCFAVELRNVFALRETSSNSHNVRIWITFSRVNPYFMACSCIVIATRHLFSTTKLFSKVFLFSLRLPHSKDKFAAFALRHLVYRILYFRPFTLIALQIASPVQRVFLFVFV